MKIQTINRLFSTRAAMMLLMMLLTTASAWAEEVTLVYNVTCQTTMTPHTTTLARSGDSSKKITWNFSNGYPWAANASHGVDDEYDITFTPDKALSTANNNTMMSPLRLPTSTTSSRTLAARALPLPPSPLTSAASRSPCPQRTSALRLRSPRFIR